jgi:TetR/AcrR family transcriptional repressor of lmrAB and yxaGH operons
MGKGEETRARLIEKTGELLAMQGYHATGLNQITKESNTPMGSVYHYFPNGKDELAVAAMQRTGSEITGLLNMAFTATTDPETAIRLIATGLSDQLVHSGYRKGCPIAAVTLEEAATNDAIQATSQAIYNEWQEQIARFLSQAGYPSQQADSLAAFSLTVIEGALLLCRANRSVAPMQQAADHLIQFLTLSYPR